jgi:hypothetical protein
LTNYFARATIEHEAPVVELVELDKIRAVEIRERPPTFTPELVTDNHKRGTG